MTTFIPPKRKIFELLMLPVFVGVFYVIHASVEAITLFAFGYIWNWSASNDLELLFQNKRYRMSMLKTVVNLQNLILKPFNWASFIVQKLVKILPAGIFWSLVIFINESDMPWWATFIGSAVFELLQIEIGLFKKQQAQVEEVPEVPKEII
jgi:hypothetical protein